MANQWGRDGNFQTAGSKSSSIILPILISLILGVAGGYGSFRMLSGVSGSEITERDRRIAELEKTVSELRFETGDTAALDSLKSEYAKLQRELDAADAEIESLKKANSSLSQNLGQANSAELEIARREIEALEKTIEEAGDVRNELARATKSLRVSEVQIIELEKDVADQNRKIRTLEKQLASRPTDADGEAAERIRNLIAENQNLAASLDRRQKEARKAQAALQDRIAELTVIADTRGKELSKARADLQKITVRNKELEAELARLSDRLKKREDEFAALKSANATLKAEIDDLKKKLEQALSGEAIDPTADDNTEPSTNGVAPRDPVQVERALNRMPGLDRLDTERQALLRAKLEEGACVTDSLEAVFDRVPVLALRNLMRDLRSPC